MSRTTILIAITVMIMLIAVGIAAYLIFNLQIRKSQNSVGIYVATTTSLYQIGVLNELLNDFKSRTGINVEFYVLAKGSGEALRLLADGSACIGFTHAPSLELTYISQGKIDRLAFFAYNEFILVGPKDDPANVSKASGIIEAFRRIYDAGEKGVTKFISRGDLSGTNIRELQIWNISNLNPEGKLWYLKSAQGMTQTLLIARDMNAYTLTDVGSFLNLRSRGMIGNLNILLRDPDYLMNIYSMYISTAKSCDDIQTYYVALKLKTYLMNYGQKLLEEKYGDLFNPVLSDEVKVLKSWYSLTNLK